MATQRSLVVVVAASLGLLLSVYCVTPSAATVGIPDFFAGAYGSNVFAWQGVTRDRASGLPMVSYSRIGPQWNYVTVALYGLQRWSDWRHDGGREHGAGAGRRCRRFSRRSPAL